MQRIRPWFLPVFWTGCIFLFSSASFSADRTRGGIGQLLLWLFPAAPEAWLQSAHGLVRKAGHVIEYALLSWLWFRPLYQRAGWQTAWMATLLVCMGVAILDESHQALTPGRSGSPLDILLDALAATGVQIALGRKYRHADSGY